MKKGLMLGNTMIFSLIALVGCDSGVNNKRTTPNEHTTVQIDETKALNEQINALNEQIKDLNEKLNKADGDKTELTSEIIKLNDKLNFLKEFSLLTPINCSNAEEKSIPLNFEEYMDSHAADNIPYLELKNTLDSSKYTLQRSENLLTTCLAKSNKLDYYDPSNLILVEFFKYSDPISADALIISLPTTTQRASYKFKYSDSVVIKDKSGNPTVLTSNSDNQEDSILTYSKFFEKQLTFSHDPKNNKRTDFNSNFSFNIADKNNEHEKYYKIKLSKNGNNVEVCIFAKNTEDKLLKACMNHNF